MCMASLSQTLYLYVPEGSELIIDDGVNFHPVDDIEEKVVDSIWSGLGCPDYLTIEKTDFDGESYRMRVSFEMDVEEDPGDPSVGIDEHLCLPDEREVNGIIEEDLTKKYGHGFSVLSDDISVRYVYE